MAGMSMDENTGPQSVSYSYCAHRNFCWFLWPTMLLNVWPSLKPGPDWTGPDQRSILREGY